MFVAGTIAQAVDFDQLKRDGAKFDIGGRGYTAHLDGEDHLILSGKDGKNRLAPGVLSRIDNNHVAWLLPLRLDQSQQQSSKSQIQPQQMPHLRVGLIDVNSGDIADDQCMNLITGKWTKQPPANTTLHGDDGHKWVIKTTRITRYDAAGAAAEPLMIPVPVHFPLLVKRDDEKGSNDELLVCFTDAAGSVPMYLLIDAAATPMQIIKTAPLEGGAARYACVVGNRVFIVQDGALREFNWQSGHVSRSVGVEDVMDDSPRLAAYENDRLVIMPYSGKRAAIYDITDWTRVDKLPPFERSLAFCECVMWGGKCYVVALEDDHHVALMCDLTQGQDREWVSLYAPFEKSLHDAAGLSIDFF